LNVVICLSKIANHKFFFKWSNCLPFYKGWLYLMSSARIVISSYVQQNITFKAGLSWKKRKCLWHLSKLVENKLTGFILQIQRHKVYSTCFVLNCWNPEKLNFKLPKLMMQIYDFFTKKSQPSISHSFNTVSSFLYDFFIYHVCNVFFVV
jgi:hypothetical protein